MPVHASLSFLLLLKYLKPLFILFYSLACSLADTAASINISFRRICTVCKGKHKIQIDFLIKTMKWTHADRNIYTDRGNCGKRIYRMLLLLLPHMYDGMNEGMASKHEERGKGR